jgi:chemotaxis protein methyltransferase CheR
MVERAREGRFSIDDARSAPAALLQRWFDRDPDGWRAKPELRMVTRFAAGDLLRDPAAAGRYDLVLCRNVVIYFTEPVRDSLHERLATSLRSGGYLMIGSSERVTDPRGLGLETTYPFIYRRA